MNLFCFLPRAGARLKVGVFLCAVFMASSLAATAQTQSQSSTSNATQGINNPQAHNVSKGNYIPPPPPSGPEVYYNRRWDVYAGVAYTNFLAGPQLLQRANMGGWEAASTYWLNWHWGITGDARMYIGTSGVFPNANGGMYNPHCKPFSDNCLQNPTITGPRIMQYYFTAGPSYRVFRRAKASATFHTLFGGAWGIFDAATLRGLDVRTIGLFPTQWTFGSEIGGTFDYNYSPRLAFRILQPDLMITRYSGTAQQNFAFSTGLLFRLGHLDTSGQPEKHHHFHLPFHR